MKSRTVWERGSNWSAVRRVPAIRQLTCNSLCKSIVFISASLAQGSARACTLCHTEMAHAVRAAVFGDDFYRNMLVCSLPGIILIGLAAIVHGGTK